MTVVLIGVDLACMGDSGQFALALYSNWKSRAKVAATGQVSTSGETINSLSGSNLVSCSGNVSGVITQSKLTQTLLIVKSTPPPLWRMVWYHLHKNNDLPSLELQRDWSTLCNSRIKGPAPLLKP